jgi:hypothetical protein
VLIIISHKLFVFLLQNRITQDFIYNSQIMRTFIYGFFFFIFTFSASSLKSQDILRAKDISGVKVETLSDAEIANIKSQLQANNLTIEQAESMLKQRGMNELEFAKLKQRLATVTAAKAETAQGQNEAVRQQE